MLGGTAPQTEISYCCRKILVVLMGLNKKGKESIHLKDIKRTLLRNKGGYLSKEES